MVVDSQSYPSAGSTISPQEHDLYAHDLALK